jgi:hypothetical protein
MGLEGKCPVRMTIAGGKISFDENYLSFSRRCWISANVAHIPIRRHSAYEMAMFYQMFMTVRPTSYVFATGHQTFSRPIPSPLTGVLVSKA